jgi:hypothetical protein
MRKITNFRLGNYAEIIQPNKGTYTTLQPSSFTVDVEKHYKPIKINDNWLNKLGFIANKHPLELLTAWEKGDLIVMKHDKKCWIDTPDPNVNYIKYVHELQNYLEDNK